MSAKLVKKLIDNLNILVVDGNPYMRKVTRVMLMNLGAKQVAEAGDGLSALESIRTTDPDVMLIEWDLPVLSGPEVTRIVRSPGVFPRPNLPIVMLTAYAGRQYVHEAMRAGVHEFLIKPTSPKALQDRLVSIMLRPRQMLQLGKYYVPAPRRTAARELPHVEELPQLAQMRELNALQAVA
ncbi:MAG TPA: response regulator transcription factor [Pseudolabrys sp.]|nr:response regulator transcription factor [Pseudolabrys sp.]